MGGGISDEQAAEFYEKTVIRTLSYDNQSPKTVCILREQIVYLILILDRQSPLSCFETI